MSPEVEAVLAQDYLEVGLTLTSDDPEHKRIRGITNSAFARGRVANMQPHIERIVGDLIDRFLPKGECDFADEFAVPLPIYLIADLLGMDRSAAESLRKWSDAVVTIASRVGTPEEELAAAHQIVELRRFVLRTVEQRRERPGDDLISSLIAAHVEGFPPLTNAEVGSLVIEIVVAGNESTRNTMMGGMARLVQNQDQMQLLVEDPSLIRNAVEEFVRLESPVAGMWRVAKSSATICGTEIPAGSDVLLRFDAANRDPDVFEAADATDITRKNAVRHIAFGAPGIHGCLGQMLARKLLEVAFTQLLKRLKNIRLFEERSDLTYWPSLLNRGINSIWLKFDPE